jgi:hypothetical protein
MTIDLFSFEVWPTATAVVYFLGILMHYRMSMALIEAAVALEDDDKTYVVDVSRLIFVSMCWPLVMLAYLATDLLGGEDSDD